jgi:hypothetical protein
MIPEMVKPLGPTEMNIPGRRPSLGNFCVIRRYKYAEYIMSETMKPMPWSMKPPIMTGRALSGGSFWESFEAKGPTIRRGYAGKIQTGVIWAIVKVVVDHLEKDWC